MWWPRPIRQCCFQSISIWPNSPFKLQIFLIFSECARTSFLRNFDLTLEDFHTEKPEMRLKSRAQEMDFVTLAEVRHLLERFSNTNLYVKVIFSAVPWKSICSTLETCACNYTMFNSIKFNFFNTFATFFVKHSEWQK